MASYADVLTRLLSARRFGVVLGLDRMRALLDRLGAPDRRLGRVIHVAGTNGKGSTVAILAALVRAGGARVATYTSPHLTTLRERIAIDGAPIAMSAFVDLAARVSAAGGDELTFFEQVTAIAMCAIADAHVDVTVLEVGLGGRLDATNVVAADVAVITGVALDHEAILGPTLQAIAREKAGIVKPGQRVVIGASGEPAAVPVLIAAARAVGVEPVVVDDALIAAVPPVALIGAHQRANAASALAALDGLGALGAVRIDAEGRARALASVHHPGRFEVLEHARLPVDAPSAAGPIITANPPPDPRDEPSFAPPTRTDTTRPLGTVILDGAHNPHGAAALAAAVVERGLRPALVLAVSADKDVRAIVRALLPAVGDVVATRYQQDRAMAPAELAQIVADVSAETSRASSTPPVGSTAVATHFLPLGDHELGVVRHVRVADDLATALALAAGSRAILIAGSLFLVGEARTLLLGAETDPFVVTDPAATKR